MKKIVLAKYQIFNTEKYEPERQIIEAKFSEEFGHLYVTAYRYDDSTILGYTEEGCYVPEGIYNVINDCLNEIRGMEATDCNFHHLKETISEKLENLFMTSDDMFFRNARVLR